MTTTTTTHNNNKALPDCWQAVEDCLNAGVNRIILFGPPGTGKTYAGKTFGDVSRGAHRLICTDDMTNLDVTGAFMPSKENNGAFMWVAGAALKAWDGDGVKGARLVVDEIDKAGGDVFATLLAMLDSEESASWQNPDTGITHTPREGFSAVMTTNIEDIRELPSALSDRFPIRIRINQPHPDALSRLSYDLRDMAINLADAGERRISLRTFMEFDKLRQALGDEKASRYIFAERAEGILDALKINAVG